MFNCQVLHYSSYLNSFALKLTRNTEKAEDLVQDTLCKAISNKDKFHGGNLQAWLSTIMKNIFINNLRKNKRMHVSKDEKAKAFIMEVNTKTTLNEGESKVMMKELTKEVNKLHPDLRKPFLMMYEGFKYEEIAEQIGVPIGTIKSRIHIARKNLKRKLTVLYGTQHVSELAA